MIVKFVAEKEAKLRSDGINRSFIVAKPVLIPIPNDPILKVQMIDIVRENSKQNYFFTQEFTKTQIVLHFTEGGIHGDLTTLTRDDGKRPFPISVPLVVARDGSIYRLFDTHFWAFNIGLGKRELDQQGIAIELSNYGPLYKDGNNLKAKINDQVYCSLDDTKQYYKLDKPFGEDKNIYFATFTDEQYDALIILLRYLTAEHKIPREFLPVEIRYDVTDKAATFKGIISHINYRKDKADIGPAFNWARVYHGVTDNVYVPLATRNGVGTRGLEEEVEPEELASERAMDGNKYYDKPKTNFKEGDIDPVF